MKIKDKYVLRQVADIWVVLPLAEATLSLNGMLKLNESGVLLWKELEQGSDREALADLLSSQYGIDRKQALSDVDEFLDKLSKIGCLEE